MHVSCCTFVLLLKKLVEYAKGSAELWEPTSPAFQALQILLLNCHIVRRLLGHYSDSLNQARKRHININFFVRLVPVFTGFVPGTNPVCPWDKSGEKQGQTQEFSSFYTVEARFHWVCPWDKPGLSQGHSRGRRAAQKVYVKKVDVPFSLAT